MSEHNGVVAPIFGRKFLGPEVPLEEDLMRELYPSIEMSAATLQQFDALLYAPLASEVGSFEARRARMLHDERCQELAQLFYNIEQTASEKIANAAGHPCENLPRDCYFMMKDGTQVQVFGRGGRRRLRLSAAQGDGAVVTLEYREATTGSSRLMLSKRHGSREEFQADDDPDRIQEVVEDIRLGVLVDEVAGLATRVSREHIWGYQPTNFDR